MNDDNHSGEQFFESYEAFVRGLFLGSFFEEDNSLESQNFFTMINLNSVEVTEKGTRYLTHALETIFTSFAVDHIFAITPKNNTDMIKLSNQLQPFLKPDENGGEGVYDLAGFDDSFFEVVESYFKREVILTDLEKITLDIKAMLFTEHINALKEMCEEYDFIDGLDILDAVERDVLRGDWGMAVLRIQNVHFDTKE